MSDTRTVERPVLDEAEWNAREQRYVERAEVLLGPHTARARRGEAHPVWDFLFSYYSLRPRQLRRWHPGYGVALGGVSADRFLDRTGYVRRDSVVTVARAHLLTRLDTVAFIAELLRATSDRPAKLNCFGLHEWAMVYRTTDTRHGQVPLRLGAAGTDAVVESTPLRCSHFDAYRFFTEHAMPRNAEELSRRTQVANEQPGCVHANMDLYKWAFKLGPLVASELVMDCLDLAVDARELDMRASPYDLAAYGFAPIAIETPAGRAEYVRAQHSLAERAAPLRAALIGWCGELLEAAAG
ncbi:MAG: 3-methyladenine glycosylase [Mycobacterium sp.]|nr:3-methyladenine glycosylase [Mycobacterium sp.]